MKYFIFTYQGEGLPIAYKLQQEGHDVVVGFVHDEIDLYAASEGKKELENKLWKKQRLSIYDGMVTKVQAWELVDRIKQLKSYTDCFVFFDRNNLFKFAQTLQHLPIDGNFPTEADYVMEQDRDAAKQFVRKYYPQLTVARVEEFSKVTDAHQFLKHTEHIWVLKGSNEDARTFVPETHDPAIAAWQITQILEEDKPAYEKNGFILEEMINSVIELTPGKMYYDGEPLAVLMNIENKPFGSGNTSIQTGCAEDLIFPMSFNDKINEIAFPPIANELAKSHKGLFYWDASLLIDKQTGNIYFGEFCPNRPGYNQIFSEFSQCPTISHYFESLVKKQNPFTYGSVGVSVRLFNMNKDTDTELLAKDMPISYKPEIEKDVWLWDVKKKADHFVTVGYDWSTAVITGAGTSLNGAVDKAYEHMAHVAFVGGYYRPKFDFLSREYPTSIVNRLEYGEEKGLYKIPFTVK